MLQCQLNFLPKKHTEAPTDEQLFLQLVYGLCGSLDNPNEEESEFFVSSMGMPKPFIRRLAKLLAEKLNLPIPQDRVDEWIEFQRNNKCWIVSQEMSDKVQRLKKLNPI